MLCRVSVWRTLSADASPPSAREGGVVILVGVALAIVMFWPLALHLDRDVPRDLGDSLLTAYLIGWNGHAFVHQPFEWWQTNAFWPNQDSLAFSDAFIGYTPVALLGTGFRPAIWHYNVLFLFAYALAFAGAYLLARELGLGRPAAAVAGAAFAYSPWRWDQSSHLAVLSSGGIPLCLMLLLRGYRRERPHAVLGGWLVAAWQVSIGVALGLQLLYLLAILAAVAFLFWWRAGRARPKRPLVLATTAGLAVLAIVSVVVARPYLRVADDYPESHRTLGMVEYYSPPLRAFFSAPADNLVWGEITGGAREHLRAPAEQTLFPGALVLALALFGLFSEVWPRRLRIGLAAAIAMAAIFSMGLAFLDGNHLPASVRVCARLGWPPNAGQASHAHDAVPRTPGRRRCTGFRQPGAAPHASAVLACARCLLGLRPRDTPGGQRLPQKRRGMGSPGEPRAPDGAGTTPRAASRQGAADPAAL
jgi:hypothetical protein